MANDNLYHISDYDKTPLKPVDINRLKGKDNGSSGGEPPRGDDLDKRVEKLENAIPEIRERLTRVETKLDQVATKEDIANLRAEFKKDFGTLSTNYEKDFGSLSSKYEKDFGYLRTEINTKISGIETKLSDSKSEIKGWFLGTTLVLIGLIISLFGGAFYYILKLIEMSPK